MITERIVDPWIYYPIAFIVFMIVSYLIYRYEKKKEEERRRKEEERIKQLARRIQ